MKSITHKLTAVLVALAMVLVLAACGTKTTSDAQSGEGAKTEVKIGRAHVLTPVTATSRMPSSA